MGKLFFVGDSDNTLMDDEMLHIRSMTYIKGSLIFLANIISYHFSIRFIDPYTITSKVPEKPVKKIFSKVFKNHVTFPISINKNYSTT